MATIGDSVKLRGTFYNYADQLADPETGTVVVRVYTEIGRHMILEDTPTKDSIGVYSYPYTIPNITGNLVYEFYGILEGEPAVDRTLLEIEWV
jgi:hypothetical protein